MKIFSQMKTKTQFHVKNKSVIRSWGETIVQLGNLEKLWATKEEKLGNFFSDLGRFVKSFGQLFMDHLDTLISKDSTTEIYYLAV